MIRARAIRFFERLLSRIAVGILLSGLLAAASWIRSGSAQTRPVTVAPGFEFNVFADPIKVPDFAFNAFSGPTSMAFDARGRLFVGTLQGKILVLIDSDDNGVVDQVKTFAAGISQPLGLEFRSNGDLYVTSSKVNGVGRILRLRDNNGDDIADEITTVVDDLPSDGDHQTDKLKFGPDGLLYIGQGSSTDAGTPQPGHPGERPLNGTILRLNVDTQVLSVFAKGIRQPIGLAFDPVSGALFATDVGSGELCQIGCTGDPDPAPPEEINWIVQGGNYGFPKCEGAPVSSNLDCAGVRQAITFFAPHLTPTSIAFYTGPQAGADENQMLVTIYKRLNAQGGNLQRFTLTGSTSVGFQMTSVDPPIADFGLIDPFDGPIDTAVDPISGDIYVARIDPVTHSDLNEHHNIIYRIHRSGSDSMPLIGPVRSTVAADGTASVTIIGRHLKPGAVIFADGSPIQTQQGSSIFELTAGVPPLSSCTRTTLFQVRNPDGSTSNAQSAKLSKPNCDEPQIIHLSILKKGKPADQIPAGIKPKKIRLIVDGIRFDAGATVLIGGTPAELESASATELVALFTKPMIAQPGTLSVQVRNSNGLLSNAMSVVVAQE